MPKHKWAEAERYFEQAVAIYIPYATAWSELATALQEQGRFDDAENAIQKASAADPKYLKPIVQLEELNGRRGQWEREALEAQRAISLHPVAYPAVYYYYAEADYHLHRLPEAERLCGVAIESDLAGEVPQAHYLLGLILADTGRSAEAMREFQTYEKMDRKGLLVEEAKKRIRQLASLEGDTK